MRGTVPPTTLGAVAPIQRARLGERSRVPYRPVTTLDVTDAVICWSVCHERAANSSSDMDVSDATRELYDWAASRVA